MASSPTAIGRVELQETGSNLNVWGDENNEVIKRLTEMGAGFKTISLTGDYTPTTTNYDANESRWSCIEFTDGGLSSQPTVTLPAETRYWLVINSGSTYAVACKASGSAVAAVTVEASSWAWIYCDGTDMFVRDLSNMSGVLRLNELTAPDGDVDLNSQKITDLADPTSAQDAATKNYIDTLAASGDLATVAGIASEITTVAAVDTEITTVSGISANVTTVAGISGNVTTVAGISANVTTLAGISANVTTVAGDSADIQALGPISADISAAAAIDTDISAVAADAADIGTVSANIANVNTVAGISANVTTVAGISSDVTTVAGDSSDIQALGPISANITTVAGISGNVATVAGISSDVTGVNSISSDVTTVAGISADITTIAASLEADVAALMGDVTLDMVMTSPGGLVDPDTYFARASTGTYFDSQGVLQTAAIDAPRFDHDPVTGEAKGLLIEGASTNLLTYSEAFDNAAWSKSNATITANATTAPDGTTTADKLIENTATAVHTFHNVGIAITGTTIYTASVHVKAAGRTQGQLSFVSNTFLQQITTTFDLVAKTTSAAFVGIGTGLTDLSASIEELHDGWFRVSVTGALNNGMTTGGVSVRTASAGSNNYTGDGSSGLYVWGAQLEAQSFASSYIKTEASTATRSADVYSITDLSWYDEDGGTWYVEAGTFVDGSSQQNIFTLSDGTTSNRTRLYLDLSTGRLISYMVSGGAAQSGLANSVNDTAGVKSALAYFPNDVAQTADGQTPQTDAAAALPVSPSVLEVGRNATGTINLNGHIKRLIYSKTRVPNATLEAITS
jgi:hypothetical protein